MADTNDNGYRKGEMSFREWLPAYEREQEHHSNQIAGLIANQAQLSSEVATISANVQTLLNNHSALSDRMNRPWQWGVVVAGFLGLFSIMGASATVLSLTVTPIKESIAHLEQTALREDERNLDLHQWMSDIGRLNEGAAIRNTETLRLMEELEGRHYNTLETVREQFKEHLSSSRSHMSGVQE